jgi:hypothetical protein
LGTSCTGPQDAAIKIPSVPLQNIAMAIDIPKKSIRLHHCYEVLWARNVLKEETMDLILNWAHDGQFATDPTEHTIVKNYQAIACPDGMWMVIDRYVGNVVAGGRAPGEAKFHCHAALQHMFDNCCNQVKKGVCLGDACPLRAICRS